MTTTEFRKVRLLITVVVILSTPLLCQAARWKKAPQLPERMNNFGEYMEHGVALNVSSRIGGDHSLRNDLFSTINRRRLASCSNLFSYAKIQVDATGPLADVQTVTVTVSGMVNPSDRDWVAVMSPSNSNTDVCPESGAMYLQTGDTDVQPLLCHYPVKFKFLDSDPGYIACSNPTCEVTVAGNCVVQTCSASVSFRLINIRSDVTFVLFSGGLATPCVITATAPVAWANPKSPLSGHLSSVDSTGTQMRLTWISGDSTPQQVYYNGVTAPSTVSTFTPAQMCSQAANPAMDFGWHDPGYIHTAIMTGLTPSTSYSYYYGGTGAGWSKSTNFSTPPAVGASSVRVVIYGDMGKAERDNATIHYPNPGSILVADALTKRNDFDVLFHNGDISYATGFLVEWDSFLELITPVASKVSYMTTIGNHERDFPDSVSVYTKWDSGGECGVPYETYFPMPAVGADKPWYSYSSGPIHFTIMSTEHNWTHGSEQYNWLQADLAAVNRTITPWVIFLGHRPMYSSYTGNLAILLPPVDVNFAPEIEPLLLNAKVDFAVWGHVHNYERSCALYQGTCLGLPTKNSAGIDTYDNANYKAPVHAVIGTAGFVLSDFPTANLPGWSLVRIVDYGYSYVQADMTHLNIQNSAEVPEGGAEGKQAVALMIEGDMAEFYNCSFIEGQDTLFDKEGRHFFKDCYMRGNIDFIFGDGQSYYTRGNSNIQIIIMMPSPTLLSVWSDEAYNLGTNLLPNNCYLDVIADPNSGSLTAQTRSSAKDDSGFAFVRCIVAGRGPTYLGRAWGPYSRVVFMYTWFADVILPEGWYDWGESSRQKTVFYGQYECYGPGSNTSGRVDWAMELTYQQAKPFMTTSFVDGDEWLSEN